MVDGSANAPSTKSLINENQRLRRAVEELSVLNELAREVSSSLDSREIQQTIVRRSLRATGAEQGLITLVDEKASEPMKTLVRTRVTSSEHQPFHLDQSLLGWMLLNRKPLKIGDAKKDERFRGLTWDESIQSLLCVPLLVKSQLIGVLSVYNKKVGNEFTVEDERLLGIIASQSAQVIENARLYEKEKALMRMQEEMKLAAKIQLGLLPESGPRIAGYDIAGKSIPAQSVGGDYFDFIPIDEQRLAVCLGDVTGKGLPAAMLMANVQATLRGQMMLDSPVSECLSRSNRLLHGSTDSQKFVTLFCGILDIRGHRICYSNAGHDAPLLVSADKSPTQLETGGIMLGFMEGVPFEEETVALNPGDLIVIYSDGIIEAMNAEEEEFGEERVAQLVQAHRDQAAGELIDTIIGAADAHAGDVPRMDDMTIVVVKREE